jgi:hypothetical protein
MRNDLPVLVDESSEKQTRCFCSLVMGGGRWLSIWSSSRLKVQRLQMNCIAPHWLESARCKKVIQAMVESRTKCAPYGHNLTCATLKPKKIIQEELVSWLVGYKRDLLDSRGWNNFTPFWLTLDEQQVELGHVSHSLAMFRVSVCLPIPPSQDHPYSLPSLMVAIMWFASMPWKQDLSQICVWAALLGNLAWCLQYLRECEVRWRCC